MLQIVLLLSTVSFAEDESCTAYAQYEKTMLDTVVNELKPHMAKIEEELGKQEVKDNQENVKSLKAYKEQLTKFQESTDPAGQREVLQTQTFKDAYGGAGTGYQVQPNKLNKACDSWNKFQEAKKSDECKDFQDAFEETPFKLSESQCESSSQNTQPQAKASAASGSNSTPRTNKNRASQSSSASSSGGGGFVGVILSVVALVLAGVIGFLGRKKVDTLQQKLEKAEKRIDKLQRKVDHLDSGMQESARKYSEIESMSQKLKELIDGLHKQSASLQSQVEKVAEDNQSFENTDPLADMATTVHEKTKKSGFKLGGKKEKPTAGPVSKMVAAFDAF